MRKGILAVLAILTFSASDAESQPANLYTFGPDVEITEAPPDDGTSILFYSSGQHYTAFRGDTVYVVWWESRASTPPIGNHVFFAKSTDKGQTFGPNVRVNSTAAAFNPSMRTDTGGIIYVAYERQGNIFFTKSTDGGSSFTPAVQVVDSAGLPYFQELPAIAVNNKGHVFVAWIDYRTNPQSIFTSASHDSGITFQSNVNVDTALKERGCPDISADDSGRVYVVYAEPQPGVTLQVVLARSDDSGTIFNFYADVSDIPPGTGGGGLDPSIATNGRGQIGVVWKDTRSNFMEHSLHFSVSTDYGQTFSTSKRVDDDSDLTINSTPQFPSLAWRSNAFFVVWRQIQYDSSISDDVDHVYFSYTANLGQSFARSAVVFESSGFVFVGLPSICVNDKREVFVAWRDNRYDPSFQERWHMFGTSGVAMAPKGDLNLDSLLSTVDVVLELNAVFLNQPFPSPFEAADVNCDSELTAADVVLHLNATFLGEPFPCN